LLNAFVFFYTFLGIAKSLEYCVFIRGDIVIEQGKQGEKLFIIERGSIDVFVMEPGYDPSQHAPTEPGLPVVGRKVMRLSSGKYSSEESMHRVIGSTVVLISIPPPSFKSVSLSLSRVSSVLKTTQTSLFFNPINIF
jgi:hypothetical protein